jgi:hypothetical protein
MRRSVEAANRLGIDTRVHWRHNAEAIAMLERKLARLKSDKNLVLCERFGIVDRGTPNERVSLWMYTATAESFSSKEAAAEQAEGEGDDGENASWPCPIFCPGGGP